MVAAHYQKEQAVIWLGQPGLCTRTDCAHVEGQGKQNRERSGAQRPGRHWMPQTTRIDEDGRWVLFNVDQVAALRGSALRSPAPPDWSDFVQSDQSECLLERGREKKAWAIRTKRNANA